MRQLKSVGSAFRGARRPVACSQDPEILLYKQTYHTEIDRNGSREQVAGRRNLKCQQTLGFACLLFLVSCSLFASTHHPQDFLNKIKGSKEEGAQVYLHFCSTCHAEKPIISLGAPRFGNAFDWNKRLKQNIKILFQHTEEGINAMPPRGGCFECSDEQLALALVEMLPKESKKRIYNDLVDHKKITK